MLRVWPGDRETETSSLRLQFLAKSARRAHRGRLGGALRDDRAGVSAASNVRIVGAYGSTNDSAADAHNAAAGRCPAPWDRVEGQVHLSSVPLDRQNLGKCSRRTCAQCSTAITLPSLTGGATCPYPRGVGCHEPTALRRHLRAMCPQGPLADRSRRCLHQHAAEVSSLETPFVTCLTHLSPAPHIAITVITMVLSLRLCLTGGPAEVADESGARGK